MSDKPHHMRPALAGSLVAGFMAALGVLFFWAVPESNKDIIIYMLGQLSGFVGAIVAFNYGTSKSSQDKNEIIHRRIDEPLELGGAEIEDSGQPD